MLKRESSAMVFCFCFFSLMVFHLFALTSIAVNQKASNDADVMNKINGVLKHASNKTGAQSCAKIYQKDKRGWIF